MSRLSKAVKKTVSNPLTALSPLTIGSGLLTSNLLSNGKPRPEAMNDKEAQFASTIQEIRDASPADQERILKEAEQQKTLGTGYANDYASKRAAMLNQLSGMFEGNLGKLSNVLVDQQNRQLMQQVPELAEQANLKGIFRSTGLGNSIAREAGNLAADTSSELSKQSIANQDTLAKQLATNSGANIEDTKGVNDSYLNGRYSALSRGFSLEDMARQGLLAKTTGQLIQPAPVKTPSAKGTGAIQGGLGGAATGAIAGGPVGAAVGATIGAVGGGQLGGK